MTTETYSGRPYTELVDEGRPAVLAQGQYQWKLGDLAIEVIGPAGGNEAKGVDVGLKQYAEDIGVEYARIKVYRVVASAWTDVTRVTSVPWVNYRTIYKAGDREETMASFVAKCETTGDKPSYRNFQRHLGKEVTREFTKANTRETAEQALEDLAPPEQAEVIAPKLENPDVAGQVIKKPRVRQAIVKAQAQHQEHSQPEPPIPPNRHDVLNEMNASMTTIRWELHRIHERQIQLTGTDRESVASSLEVVARQATTLADVIRKPGSATLTDADLDFLRGDPR